MVDNLIMLPFNVPHFGQKGSITYNLSGEAIPESILFVFWNVAEALIYNTDNII